MARKPMTPEQRAVASANLAKARAAKKPKPTLLKAGHVSVDPPVMKRATDELAGLTHVACPDGCRPDRCVISGDEFCAHPRTSWLQTHHQRKADVVARFGRAKKMLTQE